MPIKPYIKRFLIWRSRHISQKNFVFILSLVIGLLAGLVSVIIKNITYVIQWLLGQTNELFSNPVYYILPIIGLLIVYLISRFISKKPVEHALPSVMFALSKKGGLIKKESMYWPLITAPLTVGFGGSVGLLGPAIASAAAVSSNFSKLFHIDRKTRSLLIGCAAAGALASIFKSPVAGIIFAIEVFGLDLSFASLLPLLIASVSSVLTSYFFLGDELLFTYMVTERFTLKDTLFYLLLGLGTGIASIYFSKIYFTISNFFSRFKPIHKLIIGGILIGIMLYLVPPLYGEGFGFINNLLEGNHAAALGKTPFDAYADNIWVIIALLGGISVLKAMAMTTTLAAGGSGGIIIPTLVMGSAFGNMVAKIINNLGLNFVVSETNFTLVGMAGLMAGVLHAPLTAIFLIAEITGGYELFVPLMITVSMSFIMTKNAIDHTIYTKELAERGELLSMDKDQSVLTLMNMDTVIETDFVILHPDMKLGQMLHKGVAQSKRNLFPVTDSENRMVGIVLLDNIRDVMFDQSLHDSTTVQTFMTLPPGYIHYEEDNMHKVMQKFQETGAWNLPVIKEGKYYGFISKSKLLTAYRQELINFTT
ncbi:MAG: chloride channel protein [Bacteroidia bacterium]|nr:chloride channel protein [Bacteroidia bacterium]MBT8269971.1 chloride channel protein [Bacteroidia bacterium]NNL81390.1 chloride channel protein [Flavobacteriaceae bacterium]